MALPLYLSPFIFQLNVICSLFFFLKISHILFEGKQLDTETSENFEQLMLACADKALNNFEVLKDVPGVWDIFITKHLEVLLLYLLILYERGFEFSVYNDIMQLQYPMNLIFKKETSFPKSVLFWDIEVAFLKHLPYLSKSYLKFCTHTKLLYYKWYTFLVVVFTL